jgi:hypothetical protein
MIEDVRVEVFKAVTMKIPCSGMCCLVSTDVLEERIISTISVKRMSELGTTLAVTTN